MTDPTGAHGLRPDAGKRLPIPESPVSEHREPGGLLRVGTRVQITYLAATTTAGRVVGTIVDIAAVPAPYLSIDRGDAGRVVVFTGPGVIIEPAPDHPGL